VSRSRFFFLPPLVGMLAWLACEAPLSQPYVARFYDPDADCLGPGKPIDVVPIADSGPTPDGETCDAICITDLDGDVYVSEQCPPLPTVFDLKGNDPQCAQALAARCRLCPIEALEAGLQIVCDAGAREGAAKNGGPSMDGGAD
jgi:hypothetical protein